MLLKHEVNMKMLLKHKSYYVDPVDVFRARQNEDVTSDLQAKHKWLLRRPYLWYFILNKLNTTKILRRN